VLATRAAHHADPLTTALEELGAQVVSQPAIEIGPPDDWEPVDQALNELARYDWLVFSSANGVRAVLDRLMKSRDLRALAAVKLAAIGPGTAEELARYHLRADLVPGEYRAEALAAALNATLAPRSRLLLARASRGREVLSEQLAAGGHHVDQVVVYSSRDVTVPDAAVAEQLRAGRIDWVTVTSSAIARSLASLFGDDLKAVRLASISPVTTATLAELGLRPAAEATTYTLGGLVDAIQAAKAAEPSPQGRA
jgi:uroporphyrinogen III methyltransferase/synthase